MGPTRRSSSGGIEARPRINTTGGASCCSIEARKWIREAGLGDWPTLLIKRQGEQPQCLADQGEQYRCLADARRNRGSLLVLGRHSHANRGSNAHKLVSIGGASWCLADAQVTRGPLGTRPTLNSIRGGSWCSTEARSTRGAARCSAEAHFQSSFLIDIASLCSTDAHFKRRSLLVLGRRLFQKAEPLGARLKLILIGGASWCSANAHSKGGASWCSAKAHFDRRSLLVLGRSSF